MPCRQSLPKHPEFEALSECSVRSKPSYRQWKSEPIYHSLGINPKGFVYDIQDRPRPILDHGEVMKEVLS